MAQLIKIGKMWYSDLRLKCDGIQCPTPLKDPPHSHRTRKALSTNSAVAQTLLGDLTKTQIARRHGLAAAGEIQWSEFKRRYLEYSKGKNPQTHYRDQLAIRYLEAELHPAKLSDITVEQMESLRDRLKANGKGDWNINRVLGATKAMMRKAEAWKFAVPQDWRQVKRFKTPKGRLLFWTPEECQKLYRVCLGTWKTVAYLSVMAGMRRGEILALPWSNVDFERNRIHIVANEEWTPKDFERRWVPMKQELRGHLEKLSRSSELVLGADKPTLGSLTSYFRRLVKRANLTGSLHTGRHTYAAHLAMAGIPLVAIKQRMGHASIDTTEIYAHLCPETMADRYPA